ncbi:carboxymuconolactone decarboxylase family protein [Paracoccus sp. MBLB3053]|uniref:Carboxymuconolactone decarboxylase family protein n=1 Tax=Paracoccus aurantius TaxID=3073814 RepID=A0ABU2HM77_9RHOB|nr:carboxymuconolactone decarboxylase family protein [Paracoccus sp. MBLB3053]MDS9466131.1 carboxymuconolactone decarboxylase family protein [Paracoccus sp. MBLB3053]
MEYGEKIEAMRNELRVMNRAIPETMKGFGTLSKAVKESGTLDDRTKEMIALGMAIVQRCEPCILFHVEGLMKAGATRDELCDVLSMAIQMSGGPGVMYAGHAMACWDELAASAS